MPSTLSLGPGAGTTLLLDRCSLSRPRLVGSVLKWLGSDLEANDTEAKPQRRLEVPGSEILSYFRDMDKDKYLIFGNSCMDRLLVSMNIFVCSWTFGNWVTTLFYCRDNGDIF